MTKGQAFCQNLFSHLTPAPVILSHEQESAMVGWVAEVRWETGFLPRDFTGRGSAVRVGCGGEGEIPRVDALAGEIHGLSGGVLLPDGQSLPYPAGGSADGGG